MIYLKQFFGFYTSAVITLLLFLKLAIGISIDLRIIGGDEAEDNQFKYNVYLETTTGLYICGGGIIGDRHILTAAHCIIDSNRDTFFNRTYYVVAGTGSRVDKSGATIVPVEKIFVPSYYRSQDIADIAVLKLKESLGLAHNKNLSKLELPTDQRLTYEGEEAVISGFGYTWIEYKVNWDNKTGVVTGGELSEKLRFATAEIISTEDCRRMYNRYQPVYMVQICTKLRQRNNEKSEGVCNGDSGSPLVYNNKIIIGVVSRGPLTCSEIFVPSRHTRVSSYIQFIENSMNETNLDENQRVHSFDV